MPAPSTHTTLSTTFSSRPNGSNQCNLKDIILCILCIQCEISLPGRLLHRQSHQNSSKAIKNISLAESPVRGGKCIGRGGAQRNPCATASPIHSSHARGGRKPERLRVAAGRGKPRPYHHRVEAELLQLQNCRTTSKT